jgi:hypothetical protein
MSAPENKINKKTRKDPGIHCPFACHYCIGCLRLEMVS